MKKFFYGLAVCLLLVVSVFVLSGCGETIESLGIKNGIIKTEYVVGEAFDKSSGVLVAKIGSRYVDIALTDRAVTIEGFSTETEVTNATATIKYKGKSCTFDYSVSLKRVEGAGVKGSYSFTYDGTNVKDKLLNDIYNNQTAGISKTDIIFTDLEGKPWAGITDVPDNNNNSVTIYVKVQKQGYASYTKQTNVIVNKRALTATLYIVDKNGNKQTVGTGNSVEYTSDGFDLAIEYVGLAEVDKEKFVPDATNQAKARPFICTSTQTKSGLDTSFLASMSSSRKSVGKYSSGIVIDSSLLHNYTIKGEANCATISKDSSGDQVVSYSNAFDWEIQKATLSDADIKEIKNGASFARYDENNNSLADSTYIGINQRLSISGDFSIGNDKVIPGHTNNISVAYYNMAEYVSIGTNATKLSADGVKDAGEYKVVYTISYNNYKDITIEQDFEITPKAIEIVWIKIADLADLKGLKDSEYLEYLENKKLTSDPNFKYDGYEKGVIAVVSNMDGIYSDDLDANGLLSCLETENGKGTQKAQRTAKATISSNNYIFKGQVEGYVYMFVWSIVD